MTSGINNQLGQIGYSQYADIGDEGQPHMNLKSKRAINPLLAQVSTVTIGGTASDGDYTITIADLLTGDVIGTASFTRGSGETSAQIATALISAVNGLAGAVNVVEAVSGGSAVVQLDFEHPDQQYLVEATAPGSGTAVVATTNSGGVNIPLGRFLVYSGNDAVALPDGASATDVRGVSVRELHLVNQGSPLASANDYIPPGTTMAAGFDGKILMRNNGSVASARGGLVYVVINTAGGDELGEARADDDGANSIPLDARAAYWDGVTPAGEVGWVNLRL